MTSPVPIQTNTTPNNGYTISQTRAYVDGTLKITYNGRSIGTTLNIAPVAHQLHIQSIDNANHPYDGFSNFIVNNSAADNRYCNTNETTTFANQSDGPAQLPNTCVRTALADTPALGSTVFVIAGSSTDLQSKLSAATCGQTIVVPSTSNGDLAACNNSIPPRRALRSRRSVALAIRMAGSLWKRTS